MGTVNPVRPCQPVIIAAIQQAGEPISHRSRWIASSNAYDTGSDCPSREVPGSALSRLSDLHAGGIMSIAIASVCAEWVQTGWDLRPIGLDRLQAWLI